MHDHSRTAFLLAAFALAVLLTGMGVSASNQDPVPRPEQESKGGQKKESKSDEPVAITERSKQVQAPTSDVLADDQFGNFRFPFINNKGEIGFLGLHSNKAEKRGFGQEFYIRKPDGSWAVFSEGVKVESYPEPIREYSISNLNDNGDLTFVGSFGDDTMPQAANDPHDPTAHTIQIRKQALFLRNAKEVRSLVRLGDEVPNMPSVFSGVSNASTNSKGATAFIGTYSEPDGRGLFINENGKTRIVVRSGQRVSKDDTLSFSEHYFPSGINERGEVAFLVRLGDKSAIYITRPDGIELISMTGKPSPIKGANYLGYANRAPSLNDKGEVAFAAFFDGPDAGRGLFLWSGGKASIVARSGETIEGTTYNFTDFISPSINNRGEIAFIGNFGGRSRGIFVKTARGVEKVAAMDEPAPGLTKDDIFNNFTAPALNDRGELVFYAQWKNPRTGVSIGIFHRDEKGALKLLVKRGDKLPKP